MKIKKKNLIIIIAIVCAIVTSLLFIFPNTFSETATSSAWDGVIATSFTSGTGTNENPYVISSAGEYAYLKSILESDDAELYIDKKYVITSSFNYGEYDIAIENEIPFSGTIDGQGNTIYNANISNHLFKSLNGATIKNISIKDIKYSLNEETGAILTKEINKSNIEMIVIDGSATVQETSKFGGLVYSSEESNYTNIVLDYNVDSESEEIYKFAYELNKDTGNNILINESELKNTKEETNIEIETYDNTDLSKIENIDDYGNDDYKIIINNNSFMIENKNIQVPEEEPKEENNDDKNEPVNETPKPSKGPAKAPVSGSFTTHTTGVDGTTVYINDLTADKNYLTGLNYAEVRNTSIPSGTSTGYYDEDYLVKVRIIYDGKDINNSNIVGEVSPINSENANKFVYYKYYALERNSSGTLLTNAAGDNYIKIELIDNPFSKRPYTNVMEYGFNGWVCNQDSDSSANLCSNSKFTFDKTTYTRYMEVSAEGNTELSIHLNASWGQADVVTSYSNISNFSSMQMQPIQTHPEEETIHHTATVTWRRNYATPEFYDTYVRGDGYMPTGYYYKTNQNGSTYTRINNNTRCSYGSTCYVYRINNPGITSGSLYNGGTVEFFTNFNNNNSVTSTTITAYNSTYMNMVADPNGNYEYDEVNTIQVLDLQGGQTAGGYFYRVTNPTTAMINTREYYTSNGTLCTSASSCTTAYKLIHYNDSRTKSNGNSIYLIESSGTNNIVDKANYYYLVTRDLNIFRYTSTSRLSSRYIEVNRPFTITGTEKNGTTATGIIEYYNTYDIEVQNDLVIENIRFYGAQSSGTDDASLGDDSKTSRVIYANSNNLKIGRNISNSRGSTYLAGNSIFGGTDTDVSGTFKVIVESGFYYAYHSGAMTSTSDDFTLNEITILGSDYDRAKKDDLKLRFNIGLDGYAYGHHTAGNSSLFASFTTIKSGRFGYNSDGTANSDSTAGLYIGGRASKCVESITGAKVEGGTINTIVGGYAYNGSATTNSTYIGMSGGTVRAIYGGAGHSTTVGNRIINVTGGQINYSILGGSDSNGTTDTDDGVVQGSTLVYVGGNVTVGDGSTDTLYGVESGSVFGAGGGRSGSNYTKKGTVYNSHVIINGGTIKTAVYGGGNYGSTGTQYSAAANTTIDIISGTIEDIYGGSKSAGFSQNNYRANSTININVSGGTIENIYGGSNTSGTAYGSVNMNISNGSINNNIYGGGKGQSTFVSNNINITIGTSNVTGKPTIGGNVYGGSALGTVNSTSTTGTAYGNVAVTVNNGVITGSVFGGGEGDSTSTPTITPYVLGNITTTINGGDITNVFGGNDQAGSHTQTNHVYLNGGTITNVYGGGNKSSVTTTNVHLQGSTVTSLYGGSNTSGSVTTANVSITDGQVGNAYGGNNEGGSCGSTNVIVQGTAKVTSAIYGGGNEVDTINTNITLNSATGTIPSVYGGGNEASVTNTARIAQNGVTVTSLYGGSNTSGSVAASVITQNAGTSTNIYGGNNAGGSTVSSTIDYYGGTSTNVFGGGNSASHGTAVITAINGSITNIYGGGNNEGVTNTTVNVGTQNTTSLNIGTVYGGSNVLGTVSASSITINNGSITDVYGGNNLGGTLTSPTITMTGGTITGSIYGGGNQARALNNSTITISGGTAANVFGAGNLAEVTGNAIVTVTGGTISGSIYGGGNEGEVLGNTTVTLKNCTIGDKAFAGGNGTAATVRGNTTINVGQNTTVGTAQSTGLSGSVFGSGNQAPTGRSSTDNSVATVNITGGTIHGNVYGGANTSVVYGTVALNIGKNTITDNTLLTNLGYSDITINGTIYGGGESNASGSPTFDYDAISVTQGIEIKIDASGYNNFNTYGSIFGSGNASNTPIDKPSRITIKNYGTVSNPHANKSIQRTKNLIIDNSAIELSGVRDSTDNYHPNELFSLNRIEQLIIKNNSSLFLREGTNYLEEFNSQDASGNKATVTITDNGITKNVDNRLYTIEGGHVNIAHDGSATDYGNVYGMTFFGMYNVNQSGVVSTKMYNPNINDGDSVNWADVPTTGSYVLGKHENNHDITIDGFYSNFFQEETVTAKVKYIEPTPASSNYYYWMIGENVTEYNVNLEASKYSTLGTVELILRGLEAPNTSFQILGFDYSGLNSGINLVDKGTIRGLANTQEIANSTFGLSMETGNVGWLTSGFTNYFNSTPAYTGKDYYAGDNTSNAPSFLFYLYHYKNLSETKSLGTVVIQMMAITQIDDINSELERLIITVDLSTAIYDTTEYEGTMTPGKKYELFTSTTTKITDKSSFSAYYSLYDPTTNLYKPGYKHVLTSNYIFPENTKFTLIDLSLQTPKYYYFIMSSQDVAAATTELATYNEVSYPLSKFIMMDTVGNDKYNDSVMNSQYYRANVGSLEEFIIQVDLSETTITSDQLTKYLYPELQDEDGNLIISALAIERPDLQFNIYTNSASSIEASAEISGNPIYNGQNSLISVESTFISTEQLSETIYDTTYYEDNMGLLIYLTRETVDENDNIIEEKISGNALLGAYFTINGVNYYPDAAGDTRLKFADRVGNIKRYITFNMSNANIPTGDYKINLEIFGSNDGIHYSNDSFKQSSTETINVRIILSSYGLKATLNEDSIIIVNDGNEKQLRGTVEYTSYLTNPTIRLRLYRRSYTTVNSRDYELVDLQEYIEDELTTTPIENCYILIPHPSQTNSFALELLTDDLLTGTYRLDFELYDNNSLIGKHEVYLVIKNEYYDE